MWRAKLSEQEAKNYPDHVLGKWLGKETPQATTKAKDTLKEALASLPALGAQLKQPVDEIDNLHLIGRRSFRQGFVLEVP